MRPARLSELLSEPEPADRPIVLDVRWRLAGPPAEQDYAVGHLPGAVFVDLDTELAAPPGDGGRHPLPEPAALERTFRRAGIGPASTVVCYDDQDGTAAARAWWLLRWLGHPADRTYVLDGGYAAWMSEGLQVTDALATPTPGDLVARPGSMPVLDADAAAAVAHGGVLLDARAAPRFRGEVEPMDPRAGHIPGARNAPAGANLGDDGRWLTPDALAARFERLGVPDARRPDPPRSDEPEQVSEVGAYCGSGVTATALVLAMEYSGVRSPDRPAALYAGSWSNWCTDEYRPVSTGEGG